MIKPAPAATQGASACERVCDRTRELGCKNQPGCLANCVMMAQIKPCAGPFAAFYACLEQQGRDHWECSAEGVPALREGFCESEQEATSRCLEQQVNQ